MAAALVSGAGAVIGAALCWWILLRQARIRAEAVFEPHTAAESRRIGREVLSDQRASLKRSIGHDLAIEVLALGAVGERFTLADVRFVGHPAHFVVFEGHTEVKSNPAAAIDQVTLLFLADECELADAELVAECIGSGRFRWETVAVRSDPAETA